MDETPIERARREAQDAIRYAHLMTEFVCYLVADMQAAGILRPATKTKILGALSEPHRTEPEPDLRLMLRNLRSRLGDKSFLERELQRPTPHKKEG